MNLVLLIIGSSGLRVRRRCCDAKIRHLENRYDVFFSFRGDPIWTKFRRLVQNDMSTALIWSKSKPEVESQYCGFNGLSSQSHVWHCKVIILRWRGRQSTSFILMTWTTMSLHCHVMWRAWTCQPSLYCTVQHWLHYISAPAHEVYI